MASWDVSVGTLVLAMIIDSFDAGKGGLLGFLESSVMLSLGRRASLRRVISGSWHSLRTVDED